MAQPPRASRRSSPGRWPTPQACCRRYRDRCLRSEGVDPMSPATGNGPTTVVVPDLGEVEEAVVIDVLVKVGDRVEIDTPLITLESEKASLDLPSTAAGVVQQVTVRKGDKGAKGAPVLAVGSRATQDESAVATDTRGTVRAAEPYGGEPYVDTVPIAPMNGPGGAAATATAAPKAASDEKRA